MTPRSESELTTGKQERRSKRTVSGS